MLSPLQERVARIVAGLAEAEGFALAGGAALIVRGDVDRRTRDLDFFGPSAVAVDRLVPAAEQALLDDGLRVRREIDHSGFARLLVDDGEDRTEVDLGSDARLFPVEEGPGFSGSTRTRVERTWLPRLGEPIVEAPARRCRDRRPPRSTRGSGRGTRARSGS
ncbi:MAG TPA: nucleotidyl transferase AbiEii/AbiGii toxin family protein, partial [Acidimicrobiales bacterium]|nr:nucleotidyl transferase AbiEii/AbiGii toxin family protein [Acidimicrobiales bacterium]